MGKKGVVTEKHLGFCKTNCDKVILVGALMVIPTEEVGVLFLPAHTAEYLQQRQKFTLDIGFVIKIEHAHGWALVVNK